MEEKNTNVESAKDILSLVKVKESHLQVPQLADNQAHNMPGLGICISTFIIHQIFSLARDWSNRVTGANIPQLKLGNIRGYSPVFKTDG